MNALEELLIANASSAVEAAWKEECIAAERLRDAQTVTAAAEHDLSLRKFERMRAQAALNDLRKRRNNEKANEKPDVPQRRSIIRRTSRLRQWLTVLLVAVGAGGLAGWAWAVTNVRVCSSSMTDGAVRGLLRVYRDLPYHYTLAQNGGRDCDVRFYVANHNDGASLIARDGLVAIVNPSASVHDLSASQLRDIFAGNITNWSHLGASPAPLVAAIPPDGSDEARVANAFMSESIGPAVQRSPASDIVKLVTSSSGKNAIGLVPFSTAGSAKVVAIAGSPPPSASSIAREQYPLWVGIMAASDYATPSAGASGLIAFARTHDARRVMARADLVTKGTAR